MAWPASKTSTLTEGSSVRRAATVRPAVWGELSGSAIMDDVDEPAEPPLTPQEREDVLEDLADLEVFEALLEPRGVRGLVVHCGDCTEPHYFAWDLLRGNLRHLLDAISTEESDVCPFL